MPMRALFRGAGWGFGRLGTGEGETGNFLEGGERIVRADRCARRNRGKRESRPHRCRLCFIRSRPPPPAAPAPFTFEEPARAQRVPSSDEWKRGVETIREGIARGDVYQVNLSRRMRFAARVEPFVFARALYADNPVPFAVLLVEADWAVVSNSPELFLDVDLAQRRAVTKPIKGTIARGATEPEDALRRRDLLASAKDAAEN